MERSYKTSDAAQSIAARTADINRWTLAAALRGEITGERIQDIKRAAGMIASLADRLQPPPTSNACGGGVLDALEKAVAFYDNLSRQHDEGEAKLLDEMAAAIAKGRNT